MKPLYLLCDPAKARGFVSLNLKAPTLRRGEGYIVLELPKDLYGLPVGTLVIEGPGWPPYEVADVVAWFEWQGRIKVIPPTDPRVPRLIEDAYE